VEDFVDTVDEGHIKEVRPPLYLPTLALSNRPQLFRFRHHRPPAFAASALVRSQPSCFPFWISSTASDKV
jgi:hypothetical protein